MTSSNFWLRRTLQAVCGLMLVACLATVSRADLDELSLDRWKELREAERYQMNIAEKFYREKKWKVAAAEYEKFVALYERSDAAPYSMLKWGLCKRELREVNTAIRDGFQSVIDYWPDSPDAVAAAYYIARCYKDSGDVLKAQRAYLDAIKKHKDHDIAVFSRRDLLEIAKGRGDDKLREQMLKELTFDVVRNRDTSSICVQASGELTGFYLSKAAFKQAEEAFATTYQDARLVNELTDAARGHIRNLASNDATVQLADKLTNDAVAYIKQNMPSDLSEEAQENLAKSFYFRMAELYIDAVRHDDVIKTYKEMGDKFGMDDSIRDKQASFYIHIKNLDFARLTYNSFENQVDGQSKIANTFRMESKWDNAIAVYEKLATAIEPERDWFHREQICATLSQAGKHKESAEGFVDLMKSHDEKINEYRGSAAGQYKAAGMYKEAIALYRFTDPPAFTQIAECYRALKNPDEAIRWYLQWYQSTENEDTKALAILYVARTLEQFEQIEKAKQNYIQICKNFPKSRYASTAHTHLQNEYKINITLGGAKDD